MTALEVVDIWKTFAGLSVLRAVSFTVKQGEIVCLLGPSGCGKTTLLRIIAGLETPDRGRILFEGRDIGPVPPHLRNFGLMFQDYALFPHRNVFENVAFGLRMRRSTQHDSSERIAQQVREVLELVGLRDFERRNVHELSGGEAQRVALARSLAPRPRLLMLDEPLGSLDRITRERLMVELRDILTSVHVTTLYVTHDQLEAFSVADRAIIMNLGQIEQIGTPEEIYRRPASEFVARFLGMTNLSPGQVLSTDAVACEWGVLHSVVDGFRPGDAVTVLIRPEAALLMTSTTEAYSTLPRHTLVSGRLISRLFRGEHYRIQLQPAQGKPLTFHLSTIEALHVQPGELVTLAINPLGVVLLPANARREKASVQANPSSPASLL
ncbi:MAG: iron ABC transporter ATP-binding protein [Ardenticatenia bacterium]|jgi:ABC-type Fe3+/spermidine/putrescine transport system ATPase subunit|nr:MAG: iron ABC transporter ATP-binding protein [Ardenticatenia bacterium]